MTTSGRRWAFVFGILIAFALPKRVERGHLAACTRYDVEPWGLYLVESALGRDFGVAYSSGEDCR